MTASRVLVRYDARPEAFEFYVAMEEIEPPENPDGLDLFEMTREQIGQVFGPNDAAHARAAARPIRYVFEDDGRVTWLWSSAFLGAYERLVREILEPDGIAVEFDRSTTGSVSFVEYESLAERGRVVGLVDQVLDDVLFGCDWLYDATEPRCSAPDLHQLGLAGVG